MTFLKTTDLFFIKKTDVANLFIFFIRKYDERIILRIFRFIKINHIMCFSEKKLCIVEIDILF